MKKSEMREIAISRENLVGFLNIHDIKTINTILGVDVSKKSFDEICSIALEQYENKTIKTKKATQVFEVLAESNKRFKTELFRADAYGTIYMYSEHHGAYLFHCKGGKKELNKLINQYGRFV